MFKGLTFKFEAQYKLIFNLYVLGIVVFAFYRALFFAYNLPSTNTNITTALIFKSFF